MSHRYREGSFSLPVGGTTGLDHASSAMVDEAAAWLAARPQHQRPHPIVPELRKLFGLSAAEACQAIRDANLIKARAQ